MQDLALRNEAIQVLHGEWDEYELLDAGHRKKLERFGKYIISRGEPRAWWSPELPEKEWKQAVAFHSGDEFTRWDFFADIPHEWIVRFENLTVQARFTETSKHVGIFPEKVTHWRWLRDQIRRAGKRSEQIRVLNLFAYTGIASLVAAAEGCAVTHVDSSKGVVTWARENQHLSGLENTPIRWIVDDAAKFVQREVRRQKRYDIILLDPPTFGRGPDGELWQIEDQLVPLLSSCRNVLTENPICVLITMYAIGQSSVLIGNVLHDMIRGCGGTIDIGEIVLKPKYSEKKLPLSIFGYWVNE